MKKFLVYLLVVVLVLPSFAWAGNVEVEGDGNALGVNIASDNNNRNENNLTGINTLTGTATGTGTATAGSDAQAASASGASSTLVNENLRPFTELQYGTNFVNQGKVTKHENLWEIYIPELYRQGISFEEARNMRSRFKFWHIFTPWKWFETKVNITKHMDDGFDREVSAAYPMTYDPEKHAMRGDKTIISGFVPGKEKWHNDSFFGEVSYQCMKKGSQRFVVLKEERENTISDGFSISPGGSSSAVNSAGDRAVAVAAGGQVGKIVTSSEEYTNMKFRCMNDGPLNYSEQVVVRQKATPPVVQQPEAKCGTEKDLADLAKVQAKIDTCYPYCENNMEKRLEAGKLALQISLCTGNLAYLEDAIQHFQMAELNYHHGVNTRSDKSIALIGEVEYWLASAFFERDKSISAFWIAPEKVRHENKKTKAHEWTKTTLEERNAIEQMRLKLEKYSQSLKP